MNQYANFKAGAIFMKQKETSVNIQLKTTIQDDEQIETIENKYKGRYLNKGSTDVLLYDEKTEENEIIKNFITIQPDRVNIRRSGAITMNQQFITKQITECYFDHPHGRIHMETFTNDINLNPIKENVGKLTISYTVKLNGQEKRQHELTLVYGKGQME